MVPLAQRIRCGLLLTYTNHLVQVPSTVSHTAPPEASLMAPASAFPRLIKHGQLMITMYPALLHT